MSPRSFPNYPGGTSRSAGTRLARGPWESEDFTVYENEWWHFDYKDCVNTPSVTSRSKKLENAFVLREIGELKEQLSKEKKNLYLESEIRTENEIFFSQIIGKKCFSSGEYSKEWETVAPTDSTVCLWRDGHGKRTGCGSHS